MSQLQLSRSFGTLRVKETLRNVIRSVESCIWNNPIHEHRLGSGWLSSCTVKKNCRVVMSSKLNIGQKHVSYKLGKHHIEILHRQHTSEYLNLHYLGLVRLSSSILLQFKWDVEKPETVQRKGYQEKQHGANNLWEQVWDLDLFSLVKWRLRGDLIAWIPEQQLQRWVKSFGDVTTA